jgi:hypothetical protein
VPVVFRQDGFLFFFYSNEGDPREPVHVHAMRGRAEAKFWLYPQPAVAYNRGFNARVLADLLRIVEGRREAIERAWNDHFG